MTTNRGVAAVLLCAVIALCPAPQSSAEVPDAANGPVAERLERELARQQQMLEVIQRGGTLDGSELPGGDPGSGPGLTQSLDPRIAPPAPVDRPLPVSIFEQESVSVPAGSWGNRRALKLYRRVLDADGDGKPELVRFVDPETGLLVRQEEDRNYDGMIDAWSGYERGVLVTRVLDSNDDANPDVWEEYRDGRMLRREVDRDDDGVRDAFYRYAADSLAEEAHDADNDGSIDLRIFYEQRRRTRAEADRDRDGRLDTWRSYTRVGEVELVSRIERDRKGRGFADTFETFEAEGDRAVLSRREEDIDGDGEIDVTSFYRKGKLVRREIFNPDLF